MNSRIKELAEQANGPNNFFGALKGQMLLAGDAAVEKFAELLVEECLDIVSYGGEWCSRPKVVEQIKRHFGIEECHLKQSKTVQEPVGYISIYELGRLQSGHDGQLRSAKFGPSALDGDVALYTASAQCRPLTDEEIFECLPPEPNELVFARDIELKVRGEK